MRVELIKSMEWNHVSDMISAVKDDAIGKRSIKILQVGDVLFRANRYSPKSDCTFKIDTILALVPVTSRERIVV
ncbi:transcriptional regulator [Sporosarcina sp. FSL K6-1540]|uniref:transcriptional regulator n=1 Tax=Sporosarcina TaxID=1569 RepID=UPI0030D30B25